MTYGPCGGVRDSELCEVDDRVCPFARPEALTSWGGATYLPRPILPTRFVVDIRPGPPSAETRDACRRLAAAGAIGLLGEHLDEANDTSQHETAAEVIDAGLPVIATITGRDRADMTHAQRIATLVDTEVVAVHCVTGDHPAARFGPTATATFSHEGTTLAATARLAGGNVSVAESPASPPVASRPMRLLSKQSAGADVAILNHAGSPESLIDFATRCRHLGVDMELVAPVPVITDHRSAQALAQFPGLVLPPELIDRILDSTDPITEGIAAAIEIGDALLSSGVFAAINLSGAAGGSSLSDRVDIMVSVLRGMCA